MSRGICSHETVVHMRRYASKLGGGISRQDVIALADSHEELRRRYVELIERVGPVVMAWTDPSCIPARTNAVQAEWPTLAQRLDELADTPRRL